LKFGLRLIQWLGEPRHLVELAVLAEQEGFDQVSFPHDPFMLHTWTLTTAVAARTERITVASIATNPYTTDPSEIAAYVATLDLLSAGRAAIGIGLHTDEMVGWTGHDAGNRLERTRATVEIVRGLLRGEVVDGQIGPLCWSDQCYLRFDPLRPDVPIYVAPYAADYLELSGEIGDGSLPMITPPESAPTMAAHVLEGARRAGRDPDEVDIAGCAWLSISHSHQAAAEVLRPMIATSVPTSQSTRSRASGSPAPTSHRSKRSSAQASSKAPQPQVGRTRRRGGGDRYPRRDARRRWGLRAT
jgi:5,10-methylenetetrahydromethanopterin reductase